MQDKTTALNTQPNLADPDAAFRLLVEAHRGLSEEASSALDAALVLTLANHIGDSAVLREAIEAVQKAIGSGKADG
jgi:hypothetical protein